MWVLPRSPLENLKLTDGLLDRSVNFMKIDIIPSNDGDEYSGSDSSATWSYSEDGGGDRYQWG